MYRQALKRWLLLALLIVGLYCLWPALTAVIYEPRMHDPLGQIRLVVE